MIIEIQKLLGLFQSRFVKPWSFGFHMFPLVVVGLVRLQKRFQKLEEFACSQENIQRASQPLKKPLHE